MMCESRRYLYTRRLAPVRETAITSCTSAARSSFQHTKAADTTTCDDPVRKTGITSDFLKNIPVASVFSVVYRVADSTLTIPMLRFEE
jgi:uncharacterized YccA/Bax inhibitor family protein